MIEQFNRLRLYWTRIMCPLNNVVHFWVIIIGMHVYWAGQEEQATPQKEGQEEQDDLLPGRYLFLQKSRLVHGYHDQGLKTIFGKVGCQNHAETPFIPMNPSIQFPFFQLSISGWFFGRQKPRRRRRSPVHNGDPNCWQTFVTNGRKKIIISIARTLDGDVHRLYVHAVVAA